MDYDEETLEIILEFEEAKKHLNLNVNIVGLYLAFKNIYEQKHGSFDYMPYDMKRVFVPPKLNKIYEQMNEVLESKLFYEKNLYT